MHVGFLNVSWWAPLAYFAVGAHLSNAFTSIYLHRSITHRALELSPSVAFFMRFWLWLSTGTKTKEWVACHRKHHAHVDREEDPHSPVNSSVLSVLFGGWGYYRRAVADREMVEKYGKGVPDDWWERNLFGKRTGLGLLILLALDIVLLGWGWGLGVWGLQVLHMPLQGGIINGIGHGWGYRNFDTADQSTNLLPMGLWIAGEELHNNHHADPKSACFRKRWFEVDVGWIYVWLLRRLGLATAVHRGKVAFPT